MWNTPTEIQLEKLPRLYETENIPLKEKMIHLHFFISGSDWWIVEFCPIDRLFWGFVMLGQDEMNAEWGLINFDELCQLKVSYLEVDRDLHWTPRRAVEVEQICKAQGWNKEIVNQVK